MFKSALNILTVIFACLVIASVLLPTNSNAQSAELFSFVKKQKSPDAKPASIAAESEQPIDINFKVINSKAAKTFQIPLPDGKTYDVRQSSEEGFISRGEDDYTWRGKLKDESDKWTGDVTLTVKGKAMSGLIYTSTGIYEIIPQKDFKHILVKIDPLLFPITENDAVIPPSLDGKKKYSILDNELEPFKFSSLNYNSDLTDTANSFNFFSTKSDSKTSVSAQDDGSQIDIMIVYTAAVKNRLGGDVQAQTLAQQAVAITNTAYQNSGITTRLRLVQSMEVSYADDGDEKAALNWVTNDAAVAAARNTVKADLVSMLTENANDVCGKGWLLDTNSTAFERYGFSMVQSSCAVGGLTLAHEVGHNQGGHHNPENADSSPFFPYAYGHWNATAGFRTIMSYSEPCPSCSRIPYFSNPNVSYNDNPTGIADQRDNARVINNTATNVSKFREGGNSTCSITPISSGQTINGNLSTTDCFFENKRYTDFYTFSVAYGQKVSITMDSSNFDTYLILVDRYGRILNQDDNGGNGTNSRIPAESGFMTVSLPGEYMIWATSSNANAAGAYSIGISIESNQCSSTPISSGQTIDAALALTDCAYSENKFADVYTFDGTAGQEINISMSSANFNSYLYLVDSNNNVVAENRDGGVNTGARIPAKTGYFTLPTSGTYKIYATTSQQFYIGSYKISFNIRTGQCQSASISLNQTLDGNLESSDCFIGESNKYFDSYTFAVQSGQRYIVSMKSTDFDTYLEIVDSNENIIFQNDNSGGNNNSRIPTHYGSFFISYEGTYTIKAISSQASKTGAYSVSLASSDSYCSTSEIYIPRYDNIHFSNSSCLFDGGGYADVKNFRGLAGQRIAITMNSGNLDSHLYLANQDKQIIYQDDNGGGGVNSRIPSDTGYFTLPYTGYYEVYGVSNEPGKTGSAVFELTLAPNECSTTPITSGQTIESSLTVSDCFFENSSKYYDTYSFNAAAGQQIAISMNSSDFSDYLYLLDSNGQVLASEDRGGVGYNARIPANEGYFIIPETGTYYIRAASSYGNGIGNYSVNLFTQSEDATVEVEIDTNIEGLSFIIDGQSYVSKHIFTWKSGSEHSISVPTSQGDAGTRYIWNDWSNYKPMSHTITPTSNQKFTANFIKQYHLTVNTDGSGAVDAASGWFNAGWSIMLRARPDTGNRFLSWSGSGNGSYNGSDNPKTITINNPITQTAHFKQNEPSSNNPKTIGVFRPTNGITYLRNTNTGGFADVDMVYGVNGDTSISGDWDGDGKDSLGIYRNGVFYLRNSNTTGPADIVFAFGDPRDQPIAGDWDGDGIDTIGLYRSSLCIFILRNFNSGGLSDTVFVLGNPGDVAIAGDWNGDGIDTAGVFRPSNGIIYLKNTNVSGIADIYLVYGNAGDKPLAGDWDGDGKDSIGIYRNGVMYLRNSNTQGVADIVFAFGNPGDEPIAGDWDGLP